MTRTALAKFWQLQSSHKHERVTMLRERYDVYRTAPRFFRWMIGGEYMLNAYREAIANAATLAEAYAVTARMLMGIEE
jgi:hypothetical protein